MVSESPTLYSIGTCFNDQQQRDFENIVGKGEIARNEQFLLFPQCFLLNQIIVSTYINISDILSLLAAELEEPKIGISSNGLYRPVQALSVKFSLTICYLSVVSIYLLNYF